jgi:hypothetical protein
MGESLVRVWLSGCPIAGCRGNESTDAARGGNIGLSMVMVVALRFGFSGPIAASGAASRGLKTCLRDTRRRL